MARTKKAGLRRKRVKKKKTNKVNPGPLKIKTGKNSDTKPITGTDKNDAPHEKGKEGVTTPFILPEQELTFKAIKHGTKLDWVVDLIPLKLKTLLLLWKEGYAELLDFQNDGKSQTRDEMEFSEGTRASQLDADTVIFSYKNTIDVVEVKTKFKKTKTVDLKFPYVVVKVLTKETFIGVRDVMGLSVFEVLNMEGDVIKTITPRALKGMALATVKDLYVHDNSQIFASDYLIHMVISFDVTGRNGFMYANRGDPIVQIKSWDPTSEEFLKTKFFLDLPRSMACDKDGTVYVADYFTIFKIDKKGRFIQNLLYFNKCQKLCIGMDGKGRLVVVNSEGEITIYKL